MVLPGNSKTNDMIHNKPEVTAFQHPAWTGQVGMATVDITPPLGIYSRCWGAAEHDTADAIHRRLALNALVLQASDDDPPLVLVDGDLPWWQTLSRFHDIQNHVLEEFGLPEENFWFSVSHTHAAPPLVELDESVPEAALHAQWIEHLKQATLTSIHEAIRSMSPGTIDWKMGKCDLAANRDFPDPDSQRILCGFNPMGEADDTLVVGRVTDASGKLQGVMVNYACHPTTLAWTNRAISPDFPGAMRALIAKLTGAKAFFLQGCSGDLAPRHQYVDDTSVPDRYGQQLAYAVMATLESMEPAGKRLEYQQVVESGAPLAVWNHATVQCNTELVSIREHVSVPLKNWPSAAEFERQLRGCSDRTLQERLRRKRNIRQITSEGDAYGLVIWGWRIGDVVFIGTMAEAYSQMQIELRRRFPEVTIVCLNLLNGSIGYLPPSSAFDLDLYPVTQTPFAEGCLERTIEAMADVIERLRGAPSSVASNQLIATPHES